MSNEADRFEPDSPNRHGDCPSGPRQSAARGDQMALKMLYARQIVTSNSAADNLPACHGSSRARRRLRFRCYIVAMDRRQTKAIDWNGLMTTFNHYIAKSRVFQDQSFDFLIADETGKAWYDGSTDQFMPERAWCREHIRPHDTVVDCGAHHGLMTVLFARWVGPQGSVFAYEALPTNARVIEANARINRLANVTVRPVGVGETADRVAVALNAGNVIVAGSGAAEQVQVVPLDDDLPPDTIVNFLKIDVEGSELRALRGAKKVLSQRPVVDLEIHNFLFANRRRTLAAIEAILSPVHWTYDVLGEVLSQDFRHFDGPLDLDWLASFDNPHLFCTPRKTARWRYLLWSGQLAIFAKIAARPVKKAARGVLGFFRDPLGAVWIEEESGWAGVWTRRGRSELFDAVWTKNGKRMEAVLRIRIDGDLVTLTRKGSSHGADDMTYLGTKDGSRVSGSYPGGRWSAVIRFKRPS
jgi:FkbM family methyltransferase